MKHFRKLACAVMLAPCIWTTALAEAPKAQYQFVMSERAGFDYQYEKFYLSAPADLDSPSKQRAQLTCTDQAISYVVKKSEGYKVVKSFGTSDEEQITQGTLTCLYKAGWKIYELRDGKTTAVTDYEIFTLFMGGRK